MGADVIGALEEKVGSVGGQSHGVGATNQTNHFDTALLKLALHLRKGTQLGGANRSEIGRVGEEDGPAVADELVEVNLALGSQSLKVGSYRRCLA